MFVKAVVVRTSVRALGARPAPRSCCPRSENRAKCISLFANVDSGRASLYEAFEPSFSQGPLWSLARLALQFDHKVVVVVDAIGLREFNGFV
jgi:hypothetical protein